MVGCAVSRGKGKQAQGSSGKDGNVPWGHAVTPPPRLWHVFYQVVEIGFFRFNFVIITAYRLL